MEVDHARVFFIFYLFGFPLRNTTGMLRVFELVFNLTCYSRMNIQVRPNIMTSRSR